MNTHEVIEAVYDLKRKAANNEISYAQAVSDAQALDLLNAEVVDNLDISLLQSIVEPLIVEMQNMANGIFPVGDNE